MNVKGHKAQNQGWDDLKEIKAPVGIRVDCPYYLKYGSTCHFEGQDCTFCFCPFYPCMDPYTGGMMVKGRRSRKWRWSCKECRWVHEPEVVERILKEVREVEGGAKLTREELLKIRRKILGINFEGDNHTRLLMVVGTSSNAGKSLLVAALCRIFSDAGFRVAPFKAQNMSLNSFVTREGAEIAWAQTLQAIAAKVEPQAEMNPILLKPKGDMMSQVIVLGKPYADMDGRSYYANFSTGKGFEVVKKALKKLKEEFDIIIIEGAGSPAEINIKDFDISNLRIAVEENFPAILVADIERGGVFAYLYGTLLLLSEAEKRIVKGAVINKFRGNPKNLDPGIVELKIRTRIPVLGIIPFLEDLQLPEEDSVGIKDKGTRGDASVVIGVIRLPRISNFTDFDALASHEDVYVKFIRSPRELEDVSLIIVPGTKNTVKDLLWLRDTDLASTIVKMAAEGVPVIGVCGGYQIIGKRIVDEKGLEGDVGATYEGLGLLDVVTVFDVYDKVTTQVKGEIVIDGGFLEKRRRISGYEIHMGVTERGKDVKAPFNIFKRGKDDVDCLEGALNKEMTVLGTYLHGVFDYPGLRKPLINYLKKKRGEKKVVEKFDERSVTRREVIEESLDRLTRVVTEKVRMTEIFRFLELPFVES
ncbi:MAG: cobyric acid synthase [Candidatus Wukongarchaeota archaeon]|nr:cobyric acid synthase [Candidatus Wukongarchaeota archaeon]